jgi:hypothetical protein
LRLLRALYSPAFAPSNCIAVREDDGEDIKSHSALFFFLCFSPFFLFAFRACLLFSIHLRFSSSLPLRPPT